MMDRKLKVYKRKKRHQRVRKSVRGVTERPRLVVYKSTKHIYAQLVIDPPIGPCKVLCGASTLSPEIREDLKSTKGKVEKAKLVGKLIAVRATGKGFKKVVFDRSGYKYHGRVKALAEAAREAGLEF
ncbi:MAG TPA: 50S ribosomal protein L18 [Candidatus Hydrothermia bacterium]|nr:50S ribosomal protein L18 [Candidatus Hydrothermae bacterium]MDD3648940.1 50S ribosomal protein L18 [Candidatus Hydrothermia bacterium]HOK23181.1 50S ribosomal protein L18 [Candidatus Hydrothermia bacterium]HOL23885.1 50S ribosomal protein L18 [Candidatus Hydrothermia bacterium]HOP31858.1 50S ribosomal protein L18 [Candidatus Hydrothermia bacterium]